MNDSGPYIKYQTSDILYEWNTVQLQSNNDSPKAFYLLGAT